MSASLTVGSWDVFGAWCKGVWDGSHSNTVGGILAATGIPILGLGLKTASPIENWGCVGTGSFLLLSGGKHKVRVNLATLLTPVLLAIMGREVPLYFALIWFCWLTDENRFWRKWNWGKGQKEVDIEIGGFEEAAT